MAITTTALLGERAVGAFGPQSREAIDSRVLNALQHDEFWVVAPQTIIGGCGDERTDEEGQRLLVPSVFGGFASASIADALTTRLYYQDGMTLEDHMLAMAETARAVAPRAALCVHTDERNLQGAECGCAAIAKAAAVIELLLHYADQLDPGHRDLIIGNAQHLLSSGYFQAGTAGLINRLHERGFAVEVLTGDHDGQFLVKNYRQGYVLDRPRFYAWCEQNGLPVYKVFVYDAWSMAATARQLMPNSDAAQAMFAGGDAFNTIVPLAICNSNMPVLTKE